MVGWGCKGLELSSPNLAIQVCLLGWAVFTSWLLEALFSLMVGFVLVMKDGLALEQIPRKSGEYRMADGVALDGGDGPSLRSKKRLHMRITTIAS